MNNGTISPFNFVSCATFCWSSMLFSRWTNNFPFKRNMFRTFLFLLIEIHRKFLVIKSSGWHTVKYNLHCLIKLLKNYPFFILRIYCNRISLFNKLIYLINKKGGHTDG